MPHFVFVAGAPGSGKTFYAEKLLEHIEREHGHIGVTLLSMDHYFKSKPNTVKTDEELDEYRRTTNFDRPEMIDFILFYQHLVDLSRDKSIDRPVYSFETLSRTAETEKLEPADIIVVEGIFAHVGLERSGLRKEHYSAICIETDSYLTYQARRYVRDPKERGNSIEVVRHKELHHIRTAFWSIIRPAAQTHACLFITNNYRPEQDCLQQDDDEASEAAKPASYHKGIKEIMALLEEKTKMHGSPKEATSMHRL